MSRWQEPAAAEMQVWIFTPSPGSAVVTSPLRRARTEPSLSGMTQPKHPPIRQPAGISCPPARQHGRAGLAPRVGPAGGAIGLYDRGVVQSDRATLADDAVRGPELLSE